MMFAVWRLEVGSTDVALYNYKRSASISQKLEIKNLHCTSLSERKTLGGSYCTRRTDVY